jgi:hypothetical protein
MSMFSKMIGNVPSAPTQPDPVAVPSKPAEAIAPEPTQEVFESDVSIDEMDKDELEEYGRTVGIELDRRHSRRKLIKELKEHLTNS